jgi:hypothetical protein
MLALAATCLLYVASAVGDAGNPILGTIRGTIVKDSSGTGVTVYVRGQWNWLTHNSDCNFDRAGTGVGIIWNDPKSPGYAVSKGSISVGVGVQSSSDGNAPDQMVHPVDVGDLPQGYTTGTWTSSTAGYTTNTAGDYPQGQQFNDPSPANPSSYASWKGGCGREPLSSTGPAGSAGLGAEGVNSACAGGGSCAGHPWGSWGYDVPGGIGYSHHFASRADVTSVCANFYDVHGGGKFGTSNFQHVNGANEITVNQNSDNSIQTNAFNTAQGGNCVYFPGIKNTTAVTNVPIGSNISDTAYIQGAAAGQVTYVQFHLFAPGDGKCTGTDLYAGGRKAVTGSSSVTSDAIPASQAGDYHWTAQLFDASSGGNLLDTTGCGDMGETSHVTRTTPTLTTSAAGPVTIGSSINDTATISGLTSPDGSGTITFTAYAPNADGSADTNCSTMVYSKTVTGISADGAYGSGNFTPSGKAPQIAGTYEWIASFSGDTNNAPTATKCGDNGEQSVVNKHDSSVATTQSVTIVDAAQVTADSGTATPSGTVDFQLFANSGCSGTPLWDSTPLTLDSTGYAKTTSASTQPPALTSNGTYNWLVSYAPASGSAFERSSSTCGSEHTTITGNS